MFVDDKKILSETEYVNLSLDDYLSIIHRYIELGNFTKALFSSTAAYNLYKQDIELLKLHAFCLKKNNQDSSAAKIYKLLYNLGHKDFNTLNNFAGVLSDINAYQEAIQIFEELIQLQSENTILYANYGTVLFKVGKISEAEKCYLRSLKLNKNNILAINGLASLYYSSNQYEKFIKLYEKIKYNSYATHTLSLLILLNQRILNKSIYNTLYDYQNLVYEFMFPINIINKLDIFAEYLSNHPSMESDPTKYSTVNGLHSGFIMKDKNELMQEIKALLYKECVNYYKQISNKDILINNTLDIYGWGVIMNKGGHELAHIHPSGIISGVFYVEVPDLNDQLKEGYLRFGKPKKILNEENYQYHEYYIKPIKGKVILFPSYIWHDTIPTLTNKRRISFAFDLIDKNFSRIEL